MSRKHPLQISKDTATDPLHAHGYTSVLFANGILHVYTNASTPHKLLVRRQEGHGNHEHFIYVRIRIDQRQQQQITAHEWEQVWHSI